MKLTTDRPYADPEKAARRIMEHARAFKFGDKGTPAEYSAGLKYAITEGWLEYHESGTFVRFKEKGSRLFD